MSYKKMKLLLMGMFLCGNLLGETVPLNVYSVIDGAPHWIDLDTTTVGDHISSIERFAKSKKVGGDTRSDSMVIHLSSTFSPVPSENAQTAADENAQTATAGNGPTAAAGNGPTAAAGNAQNEIVTPQAYKRNDVHIIVSKEKKGIVSLIEYEETPLANKVVLSCKDAQGNKKNVDTTTSDIDSRWKIIHTSNSDTLMNIYTKEKLHISWSGPYDTVWSSHRIHIDHETQKIEIQKNVQVIVKELNLAMEQKVLLSRGDKTIQIKVNHRKVDASYLELQEKLSKQVHKNDLQEAIINYDNMIDNDTIAMIKVKNTTIPIYDSMRLETDTVFCFSSIKKNGKRYSKTIDSLKHFVVLTSDTSYDYCCKKRLKGQEITKTVKRKVATGTAQVDTLTIYNVKCKTRPSGKCKARCKRKCRKECGKPNVLKEKGTLTIDSAAIIIGNGVVQEFVVYGKDQNGTPRTYENRNSYSLTTIQDFNKVRTGSMPVKKCNFLREELRSKNRRSTDVIRIDQAVELNRLSNLVSKTYVPEDQVILVKAGSEKGSIGYIKKRSSRVSLDIRTYSDLFAFKEDTPNSFLNLEFSARFIGITKPVGSMYFLREVRPYFNYYMVNNDSRIMLNDIDASENKTFSPLNTFDVVKNKHVDLGFQVSLFRYHMALHYFDLSFSTGVMSGKSFSVDTLSTEENGVVKPLLDTTEYTLYNPYMYLGATLHMSATENLSFDVGGGFYPYSRLIKHSDWGDADIEFEKPTWDDHTIAYDLIWQINFTNKKTADFFIRTKYLAELYRPYSNITPEGFLKFEVGVSSTVKKMFSYFGVAN